MNAYEEIKQQAPLLFASAKKTEAYLQAGRYAEYLEESGELGTKAVDLLTLYPSELAAYAVVGNVFQTLIETSEKFFQETGEQFEMPLYFANMQFVLTAGFLGKHASNPQIAGMLMMVVTRVMFTLLDFTEAFENADEKDDVTLTEDFTTYYDCMFNIVKKTAENLKLVNPRDPQLEPVMQFLSHQNEWHIESMSLDLSQLEDIVPLLDAKFEKFMPSE